MRPRTESLPLIPTGGPRGPMMTPEQVAAWIGGVSPAWVRRHVPGKVRLGQRTVRWWRGEVEAWLESQRARV